MRRKELPSSTTLAATLFANAEIAPLPAAGLAPPGDGRDAGAGAAGFPKGEGLETATGDGLEATGEGAAARGLATGAGLAGAGADTGAGLTGEEAAGGGAVLGLIGGGLAPTGDGAAPPTGAGAVLGLTAGAAGLGAEPAGLTGEGLGAGVGAPAGLGAPAAGEGVAAGAPGLAGAAGLVAPTPATGLSAGGLYII